MSELAFGHKGAKSQGGMRFALLSASFVLLAIASALLTGCAGETSQEADTIETEAVEGSPASLGFEAILRTRNPSLVAAGASFILDHQHRTGIKLEDILAEIEGRKGGDVIIDQAKSALRQEIEELSGDAALVNGEINELIALIGLGATEEEKEHFFGIMTARVDQGSCRRGNRYGQALTFVRPNGNDWDDLLDRLSDDCVIPLLIAAVSNQIAVDQTQFAARIDQFAQRGRGFSFFAPNGRAIVLARGLLLLLDDANQVPSEPAELSAFEDKLALADALRFLGRTAEAKRLMLSATDHPISSEDIQSLSLVVSDFVDSDPSSIIEIRSRLEDKLSSLEASNEKFRLGANLRSDALTNEAIETIEGSTIGAIGPVSSALNYLVAIGESERAFEGICRSPLFAAPLDQFEDGVSSLNFRFRILMGDGNLFYKRREFVKENEFNFAERKQCLGALATKRVYSSRRPGNERSFERLLELLAREGQEYGNGNRFLAPAKCVDEARSFNRKLELGSAEAKTKSFDKLLSCKSFAAPRSEGISGLSEFVPEHDPLVLLTDGTPENFVELVSPSIILTDGFDPAIAIEAIAMRAESRNFFITRQLKGELSLDKLNYSEFLFPLLNMSDGEIDSDPKSARALAVLLLIAHKDRDLVSWVKAKGAFYKNASVDEAASTIPVLLRAWDDIDNALARLADADQSLGIERSQAQKDDFERRAREQRRLISTEVSAFINVCSRGTKEDAKGEGDAALSADPSNAPICIGSSVDQARELASKLRQAEFGTSAGALEAQIDRENPSGLLSNGLKLLALHAGVWLGLFIVYPFSPTVQASVFWNPWVRKYLGLGYVQVLLLVIPPLTSRLLSPFKSGFLADARLDAFDHALYYDDIKGTRWRGNESTDGRLDELIPSVERQLWLQAVSGSGKSWFLRMLASKARKPTIFLDATSCRDGVQAAIKNKTVGWLEDSTFLEQLIYSGKVIVIIDGLNEVAAEIRSDIVSFANKFPKGRIVIATQPVKTPRSIGSQLIEVKPLSRDQIESFLKGRVDEVLCDGDEPSQYFKRLDEFVASLDRGTEKERKSLLEFLSNPMDLRLVADLLAAGEEPNLLKLQEQQMALVEKEYARANDAPFPKEEFSKQLYERRLADRSLTIAKDEWLAERAALSQRRLLIREDAPDGGQQWRFRHDKIADYFLFWAFQSDKERFQTHLADNRFIGVYILLAKELDEESAQRMLQDIYWKAGRTNDFTMGKAFQDALEQKIEMQRLTMGAVH